MQSAEFLKKTRNFFTGGNRGNGDFNDGWGMGKHFEQEATERTEMDENWKAGTWNRRKQRGQGF